MHILSYFIIYSLGYKVFKGLSFFILLEESFTIKVYILETFLLYYNRVKCLYSSVQAGISCITIAM